ncbi:recombinase RecQ [Lewinellaceae bacterium SD302]|nr:recombinase RecQ [Lewinellaceae bacterium SD302]
MQKYWGYPAFRPLQAEIIEHVLTGNDTLALLPTGGGKSICFQVPALAREGVTLVVSPLIALMKDQVRQLRERGIIADAIFSGMRPSDIDRILDNAVYGNTKLLYLSPERLLTDLARERIRRMNVSLIAVDEAHCISQWGYDFRPPYLRIAELRELHPEVPIIAVTATATPEVVQDIQENLQFSKTGKVFQQSFARENLSYVVRPTEAKEQEVLKILRGVPGTSIVYVRSRRGTRLIAEQLRRRKITAAAYHAGLDHQEKDDRQAAWIAGDLRVIVATNAFGMGIDKADVRSVIHYDLPDSPEAYFQEAGRGGRDGKDSFAVMLYHPEDGERLKRFLAVSFPEISEIRRVYRAIGSYLQLAAGGGKGESFDFELTKFCNNFGFDAGPTYHCLRALEKHGYILLTDAVHQPATVQFVLNKEQLYDYQLKNPNLVKLIKSILRTSQGAFLEPVKIREGNLANFLKSSLENLQSTFRKLHGEGIIDYRPAKDAPQIVFITERLDADNLAFNVQEMNFLRERAEQRVETMIGYATLPRCRSVQLLEYFGEKDPPPCGRCDWCLEVKKSAQSSQKLKGDLAFDVIKARLEEKNSLLPAEVYALFPQHDKTSVANALEHWLSDGLLLREGLQIRLP